MFFEGTFSAGFTSWNPTIRGAFFFGGVVVQLFETNPCEPPPPQVYTRRNPVPGLGVAIHGARGCPVLRGSSFLVFGVRGIRKNHHTRRGSGNNIFCTRTFVTSAILRYFNKKDTLLTLPPTPSFLLENPLWCHVSGQRVFVFFGFAWTARASVAFFLFGEPRRASAGVKRDSPPPQNGGVPFGGPLKQVAVGQSQRDPILVGR